MAFFINGVKDNPCATVLIEAFDRLEIPLKKVAMTLLRRGLRMELIDVRAKNITDGIVKGGFYIIPDSSHPKLQQAKDIILKSMVDCQSGSPECVETLKSGHGSFWFLMSILLVSMVAFAIFGLWLLKKNNVEVETFLRSYIVGKAHDSDRDNENDDSTLSQSSTLASGVVQAGGTNSRPVKRRHTTPFSGDYDLSVSLDETFIR